MFRKFRYARKNLIALAGLTTVLAWTVSTAAPPQANQQIQSQQIDARVDRRRVSLTLEQQVAQLQQRVRDLEREVGQLRSAQSGQGGGQSTQALAERLSALENVLRITPSKVELVTSTRLEIRSGQKLEVRSGTRMEFHSNANLMLSATGATNINSGTIDFHAPNVSADGVFRSPTAVHSSVVSATYTPGAGNIW